MPRATRRARGGPRRAALAAFLGFIAFVAAPAGSVSAHALLQAASPAPGSTLGSAPGSVKLTFGEPPDLRLSSVKVLTASGSNVASGPAAAIPGDRNSLEVPLGQLPDGVYTVTWRTVSAVDGHVAAGSFAFGVGVAPPAATGVPAAETAAGGSPAAIVARLVLYLGLIGLLGAGYVGFFVTRSGDLRTDLLARLATIAWLLAAVGTAFTVAVSWEEAGGDVGALVGSSVGIAGIARLVALGLAAIPILWFGRAPAIGRPRAPGRGWLGLAAIGGVLALSVDVAVGHAAGAAAGPLGLVAQWVHAVAAGLWIGGLAALLVAVRGEPSADKVAAVRRFSTWAAPWIGLVAITGVIRAVQEVATFDALLAQSYGLLVVAKAILLVVLAGLGATNRWWSVPTADRSLGRLRRIGATELTVATIVIALAAALVNGVPPVSIGAASAAQAAPLVATGADAGTSLKVRLAITPGTPGANAFDAVVTDFDTGAPLAATSVSLRFSLLSRTGVGDSSLDLAAGSAPGSFQATGSNLSLDGIWRITATVVHASGSAEVPFVIATGVAPQAVDVLPGQGTPTIYAVHLPDGTLAQLYLDPGRPGQDDLHATFFDAAGTERPITTATFSLGTGAGLLLSPRLLEPGHFVATVTLDAGSIPVDVIGVDAAGTQVHVHATLEVKP